MRFWINLKIHSIQNIVTKFKEHKPEETLADFKIRDILNGTLVVSRPTDVKLLVLYGDL